MAENPRHDLACILVTRKYKQKGITLPDKFWNHPNYTEDYKHQIRLSAKLLRIYDYELLLMAIKENDWLYSLGYTKMEELIGQVQDKLAHQKVLEADKQKHKVKHKPEEITFRKKERSNFKNGKSKRNSK